MSNCEETRCADFDDYLRRVLGVEGEWFWRGERVDHGRPPQPQIDRDEYVSYRTTRNWSRVIHEEWILKEYWKAANRHTSLPGPAGQPWFNWEFMALAQHHGVATRLLDWTKNPLAALHFAVYRPNQQRDSLVWGYKHKHTGDSWVSKDVGRPHQVDRIVAFDPPHVDPRITVQGGCFTVHPDPPGGNPIWQGPLWKIVLPGNARIHFRERLTSLGVTHATLFPDLDGIAIEVNARYSDTAP